MPYRWPDDAVFTDLELNVQEPWCQRCGGRLTVCDHRHRRLFTLHGPVHVVCKLVHCPHQGCPAHTRTISPEAETALALPWWVLGWDVVCWLGQRRFARHWSVAQLRAELADTYQIRVSDDAIERYLHRYQHMLAARQHDPQQLAAAYAGGDAVSLAIDGLQPEKGHETLYVVRELTHKRVWFAEALLSSATAEVQQLLARARRRVGMAFDVALALDRVVPAQSPARQVVATQLPLVVDRDHHVPEHLRARAQPDGHAEALLALAQVVEHQLGAPGRALGHVGEQGALGCRGLRDVRSWERRLRAAYAAGQDHLGGGLLGMRGTAASPRAQEPQRAQLRIAKRPGAHGCPSGLAGCAGLAGGAAAGGCKGAARTRARLLSIACWSLGVVFLRGVL